MDHLGAKIRQNLQTQHIFFGGGGGGSKPTQPDFFQMMLMQKLAAQEEREREAAIRATQESVGPVNLDWLRLYGQAKTIQQQQPQQQQQFSSSTGMALNWAGVPIGGRASQASVQPPGTLGAMLNASITARLPGLALSLAGGR